MKRRVAFSNRYLHIGIIWLVGMIIGVAFAYSRRAFVDPNNFGDIFMPASFWGMILSSVLPILISIFLWLLKIDICIYIILFINGFLFGFCSMFLSYISGYPGCLTHLSYMFAQSCCSTLLVILCPILLSGSQKTVRQTIALLVPASALICFFDYFVILK